MKKHKFLQSKILLKQRIALVIFGIFLFFILLEVSLRLGGFILLSIQEQKNLQSIKQKGTYRILCLGESTTQDQYPPFLEEILNQRNIGVHFSVIDKGVVGTTTSDILGRLDYNLNNYHPDMVVTMMGINDLREYIPYEVITTSKIILFFKSFRIYKLTRLLWLHLLTKAREVGFYQPNADKRHPQKIQTHLSEIGLKEVYTESVSMGDSLKQATELNPKNDDLYFELGYLYQNQSKLVQAEDAFKQAIELNPDNYKAYLGLGFVYQDQGKLSKAEDIFKKAIELNPKNDDAYLKLGWFYENQGKFFQAEDTFKKAIELDPKNERVYGAILVLYKEMGKPELAEEYVKKANTLRFRYYIPVTVNNYHKLKETLDKRGIRLVCVQYPMLSMGLLKRIFADDEKGIIFVDNERIFKDAVKKDGYRTYFTDLFGGEFGHGTEKGNWLLAENIANTILKEVFGK